MKLFLFQCRALARLSLLELWRRNDLFVLLVLALVLLVPLASAKPFGAAGAVRYMDEAALLLIWGYSLFIALGTADSTDIARKLGAQLDGRFIKVDADGSTNIPGLFAAGDCIGGLKQVSKAVHDGARAGLAIIKHLRK